MFPVSIDADKSTPPLFIAGRKPSDNTKWGDDALSFINDLKLHRNDAIDLRARFYLVALIALTQFIGRLSRKVLNYS